MPRRRLAPNAGIATHVRIHDRILAPDGMAGSAIPVDLCIEVIFVQSLRAIRFVIRSHSPGRFGSGIRSWILREIALCRFKRDDVAGKGRAARAVGRRAGARIIDHGVVAGKITAPLIGRGNGEQVGCALPFAYSFPAEKKNSLFRRSAHPPLRRKCCSCSSASPAVEKVLGLQRAIVVKLPGRTMKIVGAGLCDHRDRRATSQALLRIEIVSGQCSRFRSSPPVEHTPCDAAATETR